MSSSGLVISRLRGYLFTGVLILIPVIVTVVLLRWVFNVVDGVAQPAARWIFGRDVPGLGLAITIAAAFVLGAIASNFMGKRAIDISESVVLRVPIVRTVYSISKQATESFSGGKAKGNLQRVVLAEFPRRGMLHVGFVTNSIVDQNGKRWLTLYMPSVPNILTGFMVLVLEEETYPTSFTFDEVLRMIASAGAAGPASGAFISPDTPHEPRDPV